MTESEREDLEFSIPGAQLVEGREKAFAVRTFALPRTGGPEPPNQWVECDTLVDAQAAVDCAIAHR